MQYAHGLEFPSRLDCDSTEYERTPALGVTDGIGSRTFAPAGRCPLWAGNVKWLLSPRSRHCRLRAGDRAGVAGNNPLRSFDMLQSGHWKSGKQTLAVHQEFDPSAQGRDLSRHPKGVVSRPEIYPKLTVRRW